MAVGAPVLGEDFTLEVQTAAGPPAVYSPVSNMDNYSNTGKQDFDKIPVFGRSTPHRVFKPDEYDFSISGYLSPADSGQAALFAAARAKTAVTIRVLWDGTNGFTQTVLVGTRKHDAKPEGLQGISFDFAGEDEPVIVGTGPLL